MNRTVKIKLNLNAAEVAKLRSTQASASLVFNEHVSWANSNKTFSKARAHKELYAALRAAHPEFMSAMLQTVRDTALEAVKALKFKFEPKKSPNSAIRYDRRLFKLRGGALTLATNEGRIRTQIFFPEWCKHITEGNSPQSLQLCWRPDQEAFYVHLNYKLKEEVQVKQEGKTVGLDRGLVNIIATSEGVIFDARKIRASQRRILYQQKQLQSKGTRSSMKRRKALASKEKRFRREQNHIIAKWLASQSDVKTYSIEDLRGIRRKHKGKKMNKLLSSWSFFELENFLTYKCEALGIEVVKVDPRFTSQDCSRCSHRSKENRSKTKFFCMRCGFREHADVNAACNIRDRALLLKSSKNNSKSSPSSRLAQGAVRHPSVTQDFGEREALPSARVSRLRPYAVTI